MTLHRPWHQRPLAAYGLSALLAALFCAWLYPPSFVLGRGGFFQEGDAAQHVSGWLLYAADQWRLPILKTMRIAPPEGLAIFLTDSIPLAAILFKPFAAWLPEGFHYFGIWQVLSKFGQALGFTFLLRGLGARSLGAALAGTVFALFWPVAITRMGHTALATHAVLLLALGCYARARIGRWPDTRSFGALAATSIAALLIHPYLLAMVLAIVGAFTIDRLWHGPKRMHGLAGLAATALALVAVIVPAGYLGDNPAGIGGFTLYSMNILSTVCGGNLSPCGLMNIDGGQYEGFNNLGMGLIVLIPVALWFGRHDIGPILKAAPGVLLLMIGLTVYALSSRVWFGPYLVVEYSVPTLLEPLTQVFRVPGRFFWPVGYIVLAATLVVLLRQSSRRWIAGLLVVTALLQMADVRTALTEAYKQTHKPDSYDFVAWREALEGIDRIEIYPRYGCVPLPDGPYSYLSMMAAEIGATINTTYQPRPNQDCEKDLTSNPPAVDDRTILVSLAERGKLAEPQSVLEAIDAGYCRRVAMGEDDVFMCSARPIDWAKMGIWARPAR